MGNFVSYFQNRQNLQIVHIEITTDVFVVLVEQSGGGGFPYGEVTGGIVGSLALILALVALCKWDPIHKRLPFDPFSPFGTNDDGRLNTLHPFI